MFKVRVDGLRSVAEVDLTTLGDELPPVMHVRYAELDCVVFPQGATTTDGGSALELEVSWWANGALIVGPTTQRVGPPSVPNDD